MKFFRTSFLGICCMALAIGMGNVCAETPKEAVDRLWNAWANQKDNEQFGKEYMALSLSIARKQGVAVIDPIMVRSKDWKSEECLIFSMLVDFLPRKEAVQVLQQYKKGGKPYEQQAATDFLAEFEMSDVKEMVEKYSKDQKP